MDATDEPGWATLSESVVYRGRLTLVDHAVRLPDGTQTSYEVDESIPFAVATLVVDGDHVLLARQYRYPLRRWIYDLPGGAGHESEEPVEAARRELEEELGIIADDLRPLHTFFINPGRTAWPVHLMIATAGVRVGQADLSDPSEQVRLVRVALTELDGLIARGEIVDPALIVARAVGAASGVLPPLGA
ncbi:NUDIX hydrolase [Microbacterium rhizophilus]|uniref:NUDIX hydrolase n=1 Tax=Microbacterium rhizophilus TaxID=3138934 RepID=UPI0031E5013E